MSFGFTWAQCEVALVSADEVDHHLRQHYEACVGHWAKACRCPWAGCKSKATFLTRGTFLRHLENIHAKPLLCTVEYCRHRKPFRDEHDLNRHVNTEHGVTKPYNCPYNDCDPSQKAYARRDKCLKHIRETQHRGDAFCLYPHCNAIQLLGGTQFTSRGDISKHIGKYHGLSTTDIFKCRIGSCQRGGADNWSKCGLEAHLDHDHSDYHMGFAIVGMMEQHTTLTETLLSTIIAKIHPFHRRQWIAEAHDCITCIQRSSRTQQTQDSADEGRHSH